MVFLPLLVLIIAAHEIVALEEARSRFPVFVTKPALLIVQIERANDLLDGLLNIFRASHVFLAVLGPWLVILGLLVRRRPASPRRLFHPLANHIAPRHATILIAIGAGTIVAAACAYLVNS